jgi:hypothetical protein
MAVDILKALNEPSPFALDAKKLSVKMQYRSLAFPAPLFTLLSQERCTHASGKLKD